MSVEVNDSGDLAPKDNSAGTVASLLKGTGLGKKFGGVTVLSGVDFELQPGVILGVVGENGAGKSTLMKILSGVYKHGSYEGQFWIREQVCQFETVAAAKAAGISLIPQELHIAPELTVAENMFAGELPSRGGIVKRDSLEQAADEWLKFFSLPFQAGDLAGSLSPSQQRLAIIAGALSRDASVLILDEPTAALSEGESEILFGHLRRLRERGIGIIFISHRLDDIEAVCDELIVLRNGERVGSLIRSDFKRSAIVKLMIGDKEGIYDPHPGAVSSGPEVLTVNNLTLRYRASDRTRVKDISFSVKEGEIVGLFGLVGAGRTEIAKALFGIWTGENEGEIFIAGAKYEPSKPGKAVKSGIGFLTEDRKQTGIFPGHSLKSNLSAASTAAVSRYGVLLEEHELNRTQKLMQLLDVRADSAFQAIDTLSGGNQQKVLLGRWLAINPKFLVLDEPTAGVDIGGRGEIYSQIKKLSDQGCAILVISSDLDEIRHLCSRIIVLHEGQLAGEFQSPVDRHLLMSSAMGRN